MATAVHDGILRPIVSSDAGVTNGMRPEVVLATTGGAVIGHKEDAAHTSEDGGVMALVVRQELSNPVSNQSLAGTAGDYAPLTTDNNGCLQVRPCNNRGPLNSAIDVGDLGDGYAQQPAPMFQWGGTYWDRVRGNVSGTLLASAARTATTSCADQVNYNGRGVRIYINTTSVTGAPSVVFTVEEKDPGSGTYTAILTSAAVTAAGHVVLTVYPGVTAAANVAVSHPLPRTFRVTGTHANGDSITYSVGYALIN